MHSNNSTFKDPKVDIHVQSTQTTSIKNLSLKLLEHQLGLFRKRPENKDNQKHLYSDLSVLNNNFTVECSDMYEDPNCKGQYTFSVSLGG